MSILLALVTLLATLLTVVVGATVLQLRASDAAGNGLANAFLAVSMIALWGVLALALLLTALRQQRHQLSWTSVNLFTLALFALAAAGQLACLAQLTGRNGDGWFRSVLQLAVITVPTIVLLHVAWRGFGVPLPSRIATLGIGGAVALLSVVALAGTLRPKPIVIKLTADSLAYPALLVRDDTKIEVLTRPADLTSMHTNYLLNRPSDPLVIDSHFAIYELRDLALVKSALGLLIRGQGVEPVKFRMVPYEPSGTPESVRQVVLRVTHLSADSDKDAAMRRDIAGAVTLEEIIAILSRE